MIRNTSLAWLTSVLCWSHKVKINVWAGPEYLSGDSEEDPTSSLTQGVGRIQQLWCSFGCWLVTRGLKPSGSWQPHQVSPFPLRPAIVVQSFSCCKRIFHNSTAHSYDWIGPAQAIQENFPILRFIYLPVSAKSLWQCNFTYFHILDTRL